MFDVGVVVVLTAVCDVPGFVVVVVDTDLERDLLLDACCRDLPLKMTGACVQ